MQMRHERRGRTTALAVARAMVLLILVLLVVNIVIAWPSTGHAERTVLLLLAGALAWTARALRP